MTIQRQNLTRVFMYSGVRMKDPDPSFSTTAVRDLYAAAGKPELSSAEVRGPETIGNEQVYTFHRAVGTKGATEPQLRAAFLELRKKNLKPVSRAVQSCLAALQCEKGRSLPLPSKAVPWML